MTVFEDLIVELKEANLLEETVISVSPNRSPRISSVNHNEEHDFAELLDSDDDRLDDPIESNAAAMTGRQSFSGSPKDAVSNEQMATLQTVEHILSAVEKKVAGKDSAGFDELRVNKALHIFQQASADPTSPEFEVASAEIENQMAAWQASLAHRDGEISVSAMRSYTENCQPALSAQALFSLARFERNLEFTQEARAKYEFVVTRLFSRPSEGHRRTIICSREEMLGHLRTRFSDAFESYSHLYSGDVDTATIVSSFDDLAAEAQSVDDLGAWISSDYFTRLDAFKEALGENFYLSDVTAAAIFCNIAVLNRLAGLTNALREDPDALASLVDSHDFGLDHVISDAIGRTFDLARFVEPEALEEQELDEDDTDFEELERIELEASERRKTAQKAKVAAQAPAPVKSSFLRMSGANKYLVTATVIVVIASIGLYLWADRYSSVPDAMTTKVQTIDLAATDFKDLVKEARVSSETFYGITSPAWDTLSKENQEQAVTRIYNAYSQKGCKRVTLMNSKGQNVAFASAEKINIYRIQ